MQLVIMAAGMGSRFGGLKQITPVGKHGEFIIDYSIYDAKQAGFDKVIIITKKELLNDFKETIGKRIEKNIDVEYVFQDINDIPSFVNVPEGRTKPWGTGHALYSARNAVTEPFAIITADDFYGREAFFDLANCLKEEDSYGIICYQVGKTISDNGTVKRGICYENNNEFEKIVESEISFNNNKLFARPLNGGEITEISKEQPVSMAVFALQPNIFDFINKDINEFFKKANNLETIEYFTPDIIDKMHKQGQKIKLIKTNSTWKGITYKEDLEELQKYIAEKIEEGVYPEQLWR